METVFDSSTIILLAKTGLLGIVSEDVHIITQKSYHFFGRGGNTGNYPLFPPGNCGRGTGAYGSLRGHV